MLRTGSQYIEGLRDGREVYVGGDLVDDVPSHPAFRNAAQTVAGLYDMVSHPGNLDDYSYEEEETGQRCSLMFLRPRSREDLAARRRFHQAIAEQTYGLMGRSPDHVAGFVTGMACKPDVFDADGHDFGQHIVDYWRYVRDRDLYLAYAVVPPAGVKRTETVTATEATPDVREKVQTSALRVVSEDHSGVTVWGTKILATSAVLADELFIGNLLPVKPGEEKYAVTFALPVGTPGVKIMSRKPFEMHAVSSVDDPLAYRFDETDAVAFFDNVKIPWNRVFVHDQTRTSSAIFYDTPAHILGNVQAQVRLLAKLRTQLGLIRRVTQEIGTAEIPAVQERLNALASRVGVVEGLIHGQEARLQTWGDTGYVSPDRQALYAAMAWTTEYYPEFALQVRELLGGHPFQQPADAGVFTSPDAQDLYLRSSGRTSLDEAKRYYRLMKTTWDFVGSEFASRHLQYEMFYAGPKHVTRNRLGTFFRWDQLERLADGVLQDASPQEGRIPG